MEGRSGNVECPNSAGRRFCNRTVFVRLGGIQPGNSESGGRGFKEVAWTSDRQSLAGSIAGHCGDCNRAVQQCGDVVDGGTGGCWSNVVSLELRHSAGSEYRNDLHSLARLTEVDVDRAVFHRPRRLAERASAAAKNARKGRILLRIHIFHSGRGEFYIKTAGTEPSLRGSARPLEHSVHRGRSRDIDYRNHSIRQHYNRSLHSAGATKRPGGHGSDSHRDWCKYWHDRNRAA